MSCFVFFLFKEITIQFKVFSWLRYKFCYGIFTGGKKMTWFEKAGPILPYLSQFWVKGFLVRFGYWFIL